MKPWLRRLLAGKSGWPDKLLTAVVGLDKGGGWSVIWVGDGKWPKEMQAWTLTDLVEQASTAVADMYAQFPPVNGAELQFAIYPWDYDHGPIFGIEKQGSLFIARDELGGGHELQAISLERLISAAEPRFRDDSMFRWSRPIELLARRHFNDLDTAVRHPGQPHN